MIIFANFSSRC